MSEPTTQNTPQTPGTANTATKTVDLWPDFDALIAPRTDAPREELPVDLLKQQAAVFSEKMHNVLRAKVETHPIQDDLGTVVYSFYLYAPLLGNRRVKLVEIRHPATVYPAALFNSEGEPLAPIPGHDEGYYSLAEFRKALEAFLAGDYTRRVVSGLYQQSLAAQETDDEADE